MSSLPVEITGECKVGWRGWDQVMQPGLICSMGTVWLPEERVEAFCRRQHEEGIPGLDCACGIYSFNEPGLMKSEGYSRQALLGEIWLWGRVVEHTKGWKAEYAYPRKFYATQKKIKDQPQGLLEYIAFRYGVPLEIISEEHPLMAGSPEEAKRRKEEERKAAEEKRLEAARKRMKTLAARKGVEARLALLPATRPGFRNLLEQTEAEVAEEVKRQLAK